MTEVIKSSINHKNISIMKSKTISKEKYIELFCKDKRIRDRQVIYVSSEVHSEIRNLVIYLRETHISSASLVDTILRHHLTNYKVILNQIKEENDIVFKHF